jgi:uncharacterized OsmC-like protein
VVVDNYWCKFIQKYIMTASIVYEGNLRCTAKHIKSGTIMGTDAPTDNRGKGEKFSPTDLLCVSLATCMLTTMGIKAGDIGVDMTGATAKVVKHMLSDPRRVGQIDVEVNLSAIADEKQRKILEMTGNNCPVAKSVHPDIKLNLSYHWQ